MIGNSWDDCLPESHREALHDALDLLVDDFLIVEGKRFIHVNNAPSPAATASLQIGETIVEKLARRI